MEAASSPVELQVATVPLPGGGLMPLVGYGLYQIPADASEEAALNAIRLGYRHDPFWGCLRTIYLGPQLGPGPLGPMLIGPFWTYLALLRPIGPIWQGDALL